MTATVFLVVPLALLSTLATEARSQTGTLERLYRSGEEGYRCFRTPAIVTTTRGTLLAFAEGRKNGCGDAGNIDLVLKRSVDGGKTWSGPTVIGDDGENTCGNPAPVVHRETGTVLLLSTWNLGTDHEPQIIDGTSRDTRRVGVRHSTDDGKSWSDFREITAMVKKPEWTWYATGPANGIQLLAGKHRGRLVVPCDHIEEGTTKCFSHTIHSDDGGRTWALGGSTSTDQVNECAVAELSDGTLLLNMRNYGADRIRQTSTSSDGGETWSALRGDSALVEPVCQASLIRVDRGDGKTLLAFANPASTTSRTTMTVRLSTDNGRSWPQSLMVHHGPSAYSGLIVLPNGNLAILFEAGEKGPYEGIIFKELKSEDFRR